jgi:hypothetical protein
MMDGVIRALEQAESPLTKRALRDAVTGRATAVDAAVEWLVEAGRVRCVERDSTIYHELSGHTLAT